MPFLAIGLGWMVSLGHAQTAASTVDQPVEIIFYNYNLASAGIGAEATQKMISDFMDKNPLIKVEGIGVPAENFLTRLQADFAAGQTVDLIQLRFNDFDFAVHNLGAKALEDLIPEDEFIDHTKGMVPNGVRLGQLNGKTYGLAYTFSTPVLYYNGDLFRQAGLDPDHPPQTWDDVKKASLAIKEKTHNDGFSMGMFGSGPGDWLFQGLVRSNNGEVISRDRKTLKFGEKESLEAVRMMRDLALSGALMNTDLNGAMDSMAAGTLGMYLQSSGLQNYLVKSAKDKFELRATTMPRFGDKPVRPNNSGSALIITTDDPVKQRAAWELMKHLTTKEAYTIITSQIGYLPLRLDIVDDPKYLKNWVQENPLIEPNLKQLKILEPWESLPGPNYRQIEKIMMDAAELAVFGNEDPDEIMKNAQNTAQTLMPNET